MDDGRRVTAASSRPEGAEGAYYAISGWAGAGGTPENLPGPNTVWTQTGGDVLTPDSPVTLEYRTGNLLFERTISVDQDYMFTIRDSVTNDRGQGEES